MDEIRLDIINKIFENTCEVENMDNKFGKVLTEKENEIRKFILTTTPALGQIPQKKEILAFINNLDEIELEYILKKLDDYDIIHLIDNNGTISVAYPFSNFKTKHLINFSDDNYKSVFAMCAIDALGISFMLNKDIIINSECFYSNEKIKIEIMNNKYISINPQGTVVWYDMELSSCATDSQCQNLNFYSSKENCNSWKKIEKSRTGYLLNMNEALYLGSMCFKNRLN
ncbi:MAG: hypothetical protein IH949_04620 [Bacteroidetes bacterium]|nr:hypothetical protein [Bacteroidota bacterium]